MNDQLKKNKKKIKITLQGLIPHRLGRGRAVVLRDLIGYSSVSGLSKYMDPKKNNYIDPQVARPPRQMPDIPDCVVQPSTYIIVPQTLHDQKAYRKKDFQHHQSQHHSHIYHVKLHLI